MQNFEYCVPTKVVFGRDTESRCGDLVRECGGTHALVVYGGGSAVRSGLLAVSYTHLTLPTMCQV